jgi:hypothetical protein
MKSPVLAALLAASSAAIAEQRIPVSVTYETFVRTSVLQSVETRHYRSDGSVAISTRRPGDSEAKTEVIDMAKRRRLLIDPTTRTADQQPLSADEHHRQQHTPRSCEAIYPEAVCHPLGVDTLLGHRVQKVTSPAQPNRELWVAPGLNFLPLAEYRRLGGNIVTQRVATSVVLQEPAAAHFTYPPEYFVATSPELAADHAPVRRPASRGGR